MFILIELSTNFMDNDDKFCCIFDELIEIIDTYKSSINISNRHQLLLFV